MGRWMSELPASRIEYSTYVHMRMAARDDLVVLQFESEWNGRKQVATSEYMCM